jgi:hypothetical protein
MLAVITMIYYSLMEQIWFYECSLVFVSNVRVLKFPQRCNCGFRSWMRHCISGPLDPSKSGQYVRSKRREPVTKNATSRPIRQESSQSNRSCLRCCKVTRAELKLRGLIVLDSSSVTEGNRRTDVRVRACIIHMIPGLDRVILFRN